MDTVADVSLGGNDSDQDPSGATGADGAPNAWELEAASGLAVCKLRQALRREAFCSKDRCCPGLNYSKSSSVKSAMPETMSRNEPKFQPSAISAVDSVGSTPASPNTLSRDVSMI